jgi:hypothetical protein
VFDLGLTKIFVKRRYMTLGNQMLQYQNHT